MDTFGILLFLLGSLAFWVFLIMFIVRKARKVDTRKSGLLSIVWIGVSFVGLVIGVATSDATGEVNNKTIEVVDADLDVTRELPTAGLVEQPDNSPMVEASKDLELASRSDDTNDILPDVKEEAKTDYIVSEKDYVTGDDIKEINPVESSDQSNNVVSNGTVNRSRSESGNITGDGSNFDTYDIPAQQNTTDAFVLNTKSKKIHHPSCNDVKKISPENYATTNSSVEELMKQGYSTCGHCF